MNSSSYDVVQARSNMIEQNSVWVMVGEYRSTMRFNIGTIADYVEDWWRMADIVVLSGSMMKSMSASR